MATFLVTEGTKKADAAAVRGLCCVALPGVWSWRGSNGCGGKVAVSFDAGRGEHRSLPGEVTWISARAEFTPTPIQTREERADLVYAIKIRVANTDTVLKIGMPVDVQFTAAAPVAPVAR